MIYFDKVSKSFAGLYQPIIKDFSLVMEPTEFCVLIGANGCGKSTLLKLISSELQPDTGSMRVSGGVAQVVQDLRVGTVIEMTVLENMALALNQSPTLRSYARLRHKAYDALGEVGIGLEKYLDRSLGVLSGGQRQLIATVMAINSGHPILLLDEHTSALDPKTQAILMDYTSRKILENNLTVVMVTHKIDDALKYGNRLIMLHQGRIVLDLTTAAKQTLTAPALLQIFHHYEDQLLINKE